MKFVRFVLDFDTKIGMCRRIYFCKKIGSQSGDSDCSGGRTELEISLKLSINLLFS